MSSLWTPEGEHRVPRPGEPEPQPSAPSGGAQGGGGRQPGRQGPGDEASEEELLEIAKQLAAAPAEDVVANHCYGLFELGALHLSQQPPQFEKAKLAIDALGLLVDGLGERLGQHAKALSEGLSQIRLAFVRISSAAPASDGQGGAPSGE